jgi:hypothetical protein
MQYLLSDGVSMPLELQREGNEGAAPGIREEGGYDDGEEWGDEPKHDNPFATSRLGGNTSDDDSSSSDEDENNEGQQKETSSISSNFTFPHITTQIQAAFKTLKGGPIFPKLDWSSPKDAKWVNGNSLKCCTPEDVLALMKSSDFVLHDVTEVGFNLSVSPDKSYEHNLVLRKYVDIEGSSEFRVFISPLNQRVVAISQRDTTTAYPYLIGQESNLRRLIVQFHADVVKVGFRDIMKSFRGHTVEAEGAGEEEEETVVDGYVMDVSVDATKGKVTIVDFNVWGGSTEATLFSWGEILELCTAQGADVNDDDDGVGADDEFFNDDDDDDRYSGIPVKILADERLVNSDPLASYRAPLDAVHLTTEGSFAAFKSKCVRPSIL